VIIGTRVFDSFWTTHFDRPQQLNSIVKRFDPYLYEAGQAQPSLEALKKIALALHVSTDFLLFEEHERGPNDDLSLQFEAVSQMSDNEQSIVRDIIKRFDPYP